MAIDDAVFDSTQWVDAAIESWDDPEWAKKLLGYARADLLYYRNRDDYETDNGLEYTLRVVNFLTRLLDKYN